MKDKVLLFASAITLFLISCSDMEKSSFENKSLAVKKETKVVKSKKKKTKIKTVTTERTKAEIIPIKKEEEKETPTSSENTTIINILTKKVNNYAIQNDMSTEYCFLVDMSLPSGRNRFFIYDLKRTRSSILDLFRMEAVMKLFLPAQNFQMSLKVAVAPSGSLK